MIDSIATLINNNTVIIASWGAITGTIGTIIAILSFIIKIKSYLRDNSRLKIATQLDFSFKSGDLKQQNIIVVASIGKKDVFIDSIKYYLQIDGFFKRLFSRSLYKKGLYIYNYEFEKPIEINEGKGLTGS